jgi:membrane-associated phospholipid phosphatase
MFRLGRSWRALSSVVCALTTLSAHSARADTTLRVSRGLESGLTLGGFALLGVAELEADAITPQHCRWCDPPGFDASGQRELRWGSTRNASLFSNIGVTVMPAAALSSLWLMNPSPRNDWSTRYDDTLLVAESVVVTMLIGDAVKLAIARERPRVHALTPAERTARPYDAQDNLSFFSSHTAFAFTLACSAGTIASLRGYSGAPYIWGGGLALATTIGYLRIGADAHYVSDVVVGALVGSAIGVAVPLLHAHETRSSVALQPLGVSGAQGLAFAGTF